MENCLKFSQWCIQGLSKLDIPLISMLKTTGLSKVLALKVFKTDGDEIVRVGDRADKTFKNLSKSKKSKNEKFKV